MTDETEPIHTMEDRLKECEKNNHTLYSYPMYKRVGWIRFPEEKSFFNRSGYKDIPIRKPVSFCQVCKKIFYLKEPEIVGEVAREI